MSLPEQITNILYIGNYGYTDITFMEDLSDHTCKNFLYNVNDQNEDTCTIQVFSKDGLDFVVQKESEDGFRDVEGIRFKLL